MAREVPQYISQLTTGSAPKIQVSFAGAEATQRASAQLGVIAEDVQKKNTDMENLRTETAYKENLNRIYTDNRANPDGFDKSYNAFYQEFRGKLPNTEFTQKLDIQHKLFSQSYRDKVMEQYSSNVDEDHKTEQLKTLTMNQSLMAEAAKGLMTAKTPETRDSFSQQISMLTEQNAAILDSKDYRGSNVYSPEYQVKQLTDTGKIMFEALPAQKRLEVLGDMGGGFDSAQQLVVKHEGGFNPVDGNTGQPALFGINRKWHPEGYAQVEAVYKTKGSAAGQAAATAYLKKTFWDANGIDTMAPQVQGIVYDGAINHRSEFVEDLVLAAKAGATPGELLNMRQQEYDRLEASGKYSKADVASWNNRLDDYRHLEVSDYEKYITPDAKESLVTSARAEIQTQMTMEREDPAKAAMLNGARTVTDIVQPQLARGVPQQYARVMDNQTAETMALRINQAQSTDDIVAVVQSLQQDYQEYLPNAISDLKEKGKMKPEMEGALSLAAAGNPAYKEHIDLLTGVGAAGENVVKDVFAQNQYSVKDLTAKLSGETEDWQKAARAEGMSLEEIQEKLQVTASLAMAKMNKSLDGKYGDAVDFAIKPEMDMYAIRDVDGDTYRIPTKYSADAVEDGLDEAMKDKLPKMVAGSYSEDYVYNNAVTPFLSPTEDSLMFRTPMGEVVTDKSGKTIQFMLKDLAGAKKVVSRPTNTFKPIPKGGM